MEQRYLFGTPVYTLSDAVLDFSDEQGNIGLRRYPKNLIHAKWAWKDMLWNSIYSVLHKVVEVNKDTNTIKLPNDLVRMVNISVVDSCGKTQAIAHNPDISTVDILCPPIKCSCKCGGEGTLCEALDSISMRTEDVELDGQIYKKTIWSKMQPNGDLVEVANTPFWSKEANGGAGGVVYEEMRTLLCSFAINSDGCIKVTEPNKVLISEYCGCYIPSCQRNLCDRLPLLPQTRSDFGHFNWDVHAKDKIHLKGVTADRVVVAYQTSGDVSGEEVLVPEYAMDALKLGIMHRQAMMAPYGVVKINEKREAERVYNKAKTELFIFLNPLSIEQFRTLQSIIPVWG